MARVGLFVAVGRSEVVTTIVRPGSGVLVRYGPALPPLRVLDVTTTLVAAFIHPAPVHPKAHTGPGVRAHVDASRVQGAFGRNDEHFNGNGTARPLIDQRLTRDARKIVGV